MVTLVSSRFGALDWRPERVTDTCSSSGSWVVLGFFMLFAEDALAHDIDLFLGCDPNGLILGLSGTKYSPS